MRILCIAILIIFAISGLVAADNSSTADKWYVDALTHEYYASMENKKSEAYAAIESYKKVIELDPLNTSSMYSIAAIYDLQLSDDSMALMYIENALKIEPNNMDFLDKRGLYLNRLGKKHESEAMYDQIIKMAEQDWAKNKNCGSLLRLSGTWDQKAQIYEDDFKTWKKYIDISKKYGDDWRECEGLD